MEPSKTELREITWELQGEKTKAQKIAQPLLGSKDSHVTGKAFKMMRVSPASHPQ
jgi:hypothetical protein